MRAAWWWIDRWQKSTAYKDMTLAEQGAYRNLLDELWLRDGLLPDDERILARLSGGPLEWQSVRAVVMARFVLTAAGWTNATHDEVSRESSRRAEKQRRYRQARGNAAGNAAGNKSDHVTHSPSPSPSPSPDQSPSPEEQKIAPPAPARPSWVEPLEQLPELDTPASRDSLAEWVAYRRERKLAPWQPRTWSKNLAGFRDRGASGLVEAVNHSIAQGYQGLFSPKQNGTHQPGGQFESQGQAVIRKLMEKRHATA